jgi:hypothetical protein
LKSSGGSFAILGLHIGHDWRVHVNTYPSHPPILDIDTGSVTIMIHTAGTEVTAAAADFARELAERSAEYAAEMARIHAWQHSGSRGSGTPDGQTEPGGAAGTGIPTAPSNSHLRSERTRS